ncbi:RING-H2 finger protein ATL52-like [Cannabis sativa]|uniref:RING-H2 finger protein ATL52-like n=1 Tax=Cannabis sativa TaxID=3483 RepID=UPI0029CA417F|nr:RING-H2 finger protein ATL52-like [Cannabis sativa]
MIHRLIISSSYLDYIGNSATLFILLYSFKSHTILYNFKLMANNNDGDRDGIGSLFKDHKLTFLLIAAGTTSVLITIYHLISVCLYNQNQAPRQRQPQQQQWHLQPAGNSTEASVAELIPAHKYKKGEGFGGYDKDEGVVCAVCLAEFEEGEELRTLPECLHSFHAPCIDMWLFSHSTCPVCRGDATPSPSPRIGWHGETRLNST